VGTIKGNVVSLRALSIPGLYVLETPVFSDERGEFREWFRLNELANFTVAQANLSRSQRNGVRGLHYSLAPEGQAKVVTCVAGEIDDVVVDIRVDSPTYGRVEVVELTESSGLAVVVPTGVAHGYIATSERASLAYLISSPYNPEMEFEINPFDEALAVPWRLSGPAIISEKDASAPSLEQRRARGELPSFLG
jgi:dTDP-4-dehydrorhamnose 3,5-epimerase